MRFPVQSPSVSRRRSYLPVIDEATVNPSSCGSKEGFLNELATTVAIPNYFPAESPLLRPLYGRPFKFCIPLKGRAALKKGCTKHDECYGTCGASKVKCDRQLLQDWENECKDVYDSILSRPCLVGCLKMVRTMSRIQRGSDGSHEAFEATQQQCRPPVPPVPTIPPNCWGTPAYMECLDPDNQIRCYSHNQPVTCR